MKNKQVAVKNGIKKQAIHRCEICGADPEDPMTMGIFFMDHETYSIIYTFLKFSSKGKIYMWKGKRRVNGLVLSSKAAEALVSATEAYYQVKDRPREEAQEQEQLKSDVMLN